MSVTKTSTRAAKALRKDISSPKRKVAAKALRKAIKSAKRDVKRRENAFRALLKKHNPISDAVSKEPPVVLNHTYLNARFDDVGDDPVWVRIENTLKMSPARKEVEDEIDKAMLEFIRLHKDMVYKDNSLLFSMLPEGVAGGALISDIRIDKTLQRYITYEKIINILCNFEAIKIQCVRVYRNEAGELICWDGQHTLIALYIIICGILKLDPSKVSVPITISKGTSRADMRRTSLGENGDAKTPFDGHDKFELQVYGVRADKMTDPIFLSTAEKQKHLADNNLFMSCEKMYTNQEPGALTRSEEVMNQKYHPDITKFFGQWCWALIKSGRPFSSTEVSLIFEYFDKCYHDDAITVNKSYVSKVAVACRGVTGNDFDNKVFLEKAKVSLARDWLEKSDALPEPASYINKDGTVSGKKLGSSMARNLDYLCQSLKFHGIQVPEHDQEWIVTKEEGF